MQRFLTSDSIPDVEFVRKIKDWRLNKYKERKVEKKMISSFPQWTTSVKENIRCNNTAGMESPAGEWKHREVGVAIPAMMEYRRLF